MTTWLFFGVLAVVAVVAIVTVIWAALVLSSRSDALHDAIYGEGDDGERK